MSIIMEFKTFDANELILEKLGIKIQMLLIIIKYLTGVITHNLTRSCNSFQNKIRENDIYLNHFNCHGSTD